MTASSKAALNQQAATYNKDIKGLHARSLYLFGKAVSLSSLPSQFFHDVC